MAGTGNGPYLDAVREAFRYEIPLLAIDEIAINRASNRPGRRTAVLRANTASLCLI